MFNLKRNASKYYQYHKKTMRFIGWQWLVWTVSGSFMVLIGIHKIHGDEFVTPPSPLITSQYTFPLSEIIKGLDKVESVSLATRLDKPVYNVTLSNYPLIVQTYDAESGYILPRLTEYQAKKIAVLNHADNLNESDIKSVVYSTNLPPEVSSRYAHAFIVEFDGMQALTFYIEPNSGEVIAKRYLGWRVFDWMWKFHIMDYDDGENTQNWFIKLVTIVAAFSFICGLLFLSYRLIYYKKSLRLPAQLSNSRKKRQFIHRFLATICLLPVVIWLVTGIYLVWFETDKPPKIVFDTQALQANEVDLQFHRLATDYPIYGVNIVRRLGSWYTQVIYEYNDHAYLPRKLELFTLDLSQKVSLNETYFRNKVDQNINRWITHDFYYKYNNPTLSFLDENAIRHYFNSYDAEYVGTSNLKSKIDTWMLRLHFLDFSGQGHFNHVWNKIFALFFLLLTLTGISMLFK